MTKPTPADPLSPEEMLIRAARLGYGKDIEDALRLGADVDTTDEAGKSALWLAAARGNRECLGALIAAGACVDARPKGNDSEPSALWMAMVNSRKDCSEMLIVAGASASEVFQGDGLLDLAVGRAWAGIVRMLLERGAPSRRKDSRKNALLFHAMQMDDRETAKALVRGGAPLDEPDPLGRPVDYWQWADRLEWPALAEEIRARVISAREASMMEAATPKPEKECRGGSGPRI